MSGPQVKQPILCSPYEEPGEHWHIVAHEEPQRRPGRRPAGYFYRDPRTESADDEDSIRGEWVELRLVNRIRTQVKAWREQGWPGASRTTLELLHYWQRDGRDPRKRLFFTQVEAVETIILLTEARADFLQGVEIPTDDPSDDRKAEGYAAFRRYACKMATGSGKTTVMGMLAAWTILNKVASRGDRRFSDTVLVVCPNVTIRNRLAELDPRAGEASLYRTRDLVPGDLMQVLMRGRVIPMNWHLFEPRGVQVGGTTAKVSKAGKAVRILETIKIGPKTTTARGSRYLTLADLQRQVDAGLIDIREEIKDRGGNLVSVKVESTRYVESDTALVNRILGREVGGKQNILVFNDEAHHAYRIRREEPDEDEGDALDDEEADEFFKEATVWVDGLDRIHKLRGINFCVDLSATPYFLGRVGQDKNRTFPWVVSDFGLSDAIESGLVKIPQLVVRDTSGRSVPSYFNIWRWIMQQLSPAERGGKRASPSAEAILKLAHTPIAMLGGYWNELREKWIAEKRDARPPVFIIVCKNTAIAKLLYEWLAKDNPPAGVQNFGLAGLQNTEGRDNTIRVDSKVVHETDSGEAKSDEVRWMRLTLDTVGKLDWPMDRAGRQLYPEDFEALAAKLNRPLHPPGRDVRCIISVGMLTEGWDCNTVTHILGLRPFMSQLLCEQVVGRGLRRASYDPDAEGKLSEEVAQVFGVPFSTGVYKQSERDGPSLPAPKRWHIHAVPEKAQYAIAFPRVEGYRQSIRNRVAVDWDSISVIPLDPMKIPPEVEAKAGLTNNEGRPQLGGPGALQRLNLNPYRKTLREQKGIFELASALTREYVASGHCEAPPHVLFPQLVSIAQRFLQEKIDPVAPALRVDAFMSPYYGWIVERLAQVIRPAKTDGELPELPRYESSRGPGTTAEVDFFTSREPYPVIRSHVNAMVPDTDRWEQSAAYTIDTHDAVEAFVKNAGLGFAIPYLHEGKPHDFMPDFIIRLKGEKPRHLILETKGYDVLADVKKTAAFRWIAAVNADGAFGRWDFEMVRRIADVAATIQRVADDQP